MTSNSPSISSPIFDAIIERFRIDTKHMQQRTEGSAFLKVARSAYPLDEVTYIALNIPLGGQNDRYMHCAYSDQWLKHCVTRGVVETDPTEPLMSIFRDMQGFNDCSSAVSPLGVGGQYTATVPVPTVHGEMAAMCIHFSDACSGWRDKRDKLASDFQILGSYFHQHMLRIWGHNIDRAAVVSMRERECLKWIAEGKTAWEAGTILGIKERTVRFHLNAAREKLDCQTTTQAVAKAVAQQLIAF